MKPFITVKALREALIKKELSAQEISTFYRTRIEQYNPELNALLEVFESDVKDEKASPNAPLSGIPYVLKDNISQQGKITSAGSNILKNYKAPFDATVHQRLQNAGGISIGRANMDEFAMGGSGEFSAYGPTKNPWDLTRTPGGSSSGPAAAVAAGLVPFALGTETGGSVRQPAAFCGLVGLYPTYGNHSRYGVVPFASSTDQVGPMTKTVYDNALVSSILNGVDSNDATSLQHQPVDYTKNLDGSLPKSLRIGVLEDVDYTTMDPDVHEAFKNTVKQFESLGAEIKPITIPHLKYGNAIYFIIARAEAASNLARYDGTLYGARNKDAKNLIDMYLNTRHDGFGLEVKRRILTGNYVLTSAHKGEYYNKATQVRNMLRAEFMAAFNGVDVILTPTTPTLPFKLGELTNDPITMYLADYFTVPNCVIGTPALSFSCGFSQTGLPIGAQLMGPSLSEELLYRVAYAFEQTTDFHTRNPKNYG